MKPRNILLIFIFFLFFFNSKTSFSESYYFNKCGISENFYSNYTIYLDKKEIKISFVGNDGEVKQELFDKIKSITKDQIISEKIKSSGSEDSYFIYYLDSKSKSVIRQNYSYEKKSGLEIYKPKGPKKQSFCADVKSNWDKQKIDEALDDKEKEMLLKTQEQIAKEQSAVRECSGNNYNEWNNCKGTFKSGDGYKYSGLFKNGEIKKGTAIFPGGAEYVGDFKNNMPHGQGTFTSPEGEKYYGEWNFGKNEGYGTKIWKDGRKYTGSFKNDLPHGKGTFTSPEGEKYVGEYKEGKRHGEGNLTYIDGKTYIGQFVAGYEHGKGTCFDKDGSSIECEKDMRSTGKNTHNILIEDKKWIKLSKFNLSAGENLKIAFDKKAAELCVKTGNFNILQKEIIIAELDETPAFGTEAKVRSGIKGVVECK
tara:strand:- start:49 stop:1317 length:1269 start_codon:yes stop_codon:yes gene_type:complete